MAPRPPLSHTTPQRLLASLLLCVAALAAGPAAPAGAAGAAPFALTGWLTPSEADRDPSTVGAVAISADGSTLVVGAPRTDNGGTDLGSAYVFQRRGASWEASVEVAVLTASDSGDSSLFGSSVAVSDDGATVAIGAPGTGAVYVFTRPPVYWESASETARLTSAEFGSRLGASLAISADGATIVSGAPGAAAGYVFARPADGWARAAGGTRLTAPETGGLGASAAIAEDSGTIAMGAPGAAQSRGAVLVFPQPAAGWGAISQTLTITASAVLTASDALGGAGLGSSLAISADGATIVAGAPGTTRGDAVVGAAYVFGRPDGGWASAASAVRLSATDATPARPIGGAVAVSAGGSVVAVGAPGGAGAVYVYGRGASGWASAAEGATLTPGDRAAEGFGANLAISDDGHTIVAGTDVGALGAAGPSGAAAVFEAPPLGLSIAPGACFADEVGGIFAVRVPAGVALSATSLNTLLVPQASLSLTPAGPGVHLLSIRAIEQRTGAARVVVTAGNGLLQTSQTITLRVGAASGAVVNGTIGADLLVGGAGPDALVGRGGADLLCGRGGDDILLGNEGGDALDGGAGADLLQGGDGDDTLTGGAGPDEFFGGAGLDTATDFTPPEGDTSDGTIP